MMDNLSKFSTGLKIDTPINKPKINYQHPKIELLKKNQRKNFVDQKKFAIKVDQKVERMKSDIAV